MRPQLIDVEHVAHLVAGDRHAADLYAHIVAEDAAWAQVLRLRDVGNLLRVESVEKRGIQFLVLRAILRRIPLLLAAECEENERQYRHAAEATEAAGPREPAQ